MMKRFLFTFLGVMAFCFSLAGAIAAMDWAAREYGLFALMVVACVFVSAAVALVFALAFGGD